MGNPDGPQSGMYGHPGGPSDYPSNNSYIGGPPPSSGNGMMGHHSGGICSQMTLNQNSCPPNTKVSSFFFALIACQMKRFLDDGA